MFYGRKTTQKQSQNREGHGKDERSFQGEEEIVGYGFAILLIFNELGITELFYVQVMGRSA